MKVEVRELVKSFDGFRALDGLDMTVPRGAVYGLVGPNGAGKSTLIRHLAGVWRQDSGEALIDGEPVFENTGVKSRTAYIPDDIFFFPQAGIRDMMRFYSGVCPRFDKERYERLRGVFALDDRQPMRRLSKGMQKQAAFWLAISMRRELLILDEPVDGLDPVMRRQVYGIVMEDVAENGTTVLVSSHNLRELEDVCDHVGIMNKGKILIQRSLSELQDNITKLQTVLPDGAELPDGLDIVHKSAAGRLQPLIVRGRPADVESAVAAAQPLYSEVMPLTLEEIFIYELGGADYGVKSFVL